MRYMQPMTEPIYLMGGAGPNRNGMNQARNNGGKIFLEREEKVGGGKRGEKKEEGKKRRRIIRSI